jgi:hypothetical protein
MDQDGPDLALRQRLAEAREVLLVVGGWPPGSRGLVEDLDRACAKLGPAFHGAIEPASR